MGRRRKVVHFAAVVVMLIVAPFMVGSAAGKGFATEPHEQRECAEGYVALTFDDGPSMSTTLRIVNALKARGARATFFDVGSQVQKYPHLVQQTRAAGMEIANHSYDHPFLDELKAPAVHNELLGTSQIIADVVGSAPTLFRPPFGKTNATVNAEAMSLGMLEVLWTYDTYDWNGAGVEAIKATVQNAKNGDIILMHDAGYQATADAISGIVDDLYERGMCTGRVVRSAIARQAWMDYDGPRVVYDAVAVRW